METYATNRYGLKAFIDEGELHFADDPFKTWERRVADAVLNLAWRSTALSGTGTGKVLMVKYPQTDNTGYVVRTWDEADGGILGGEYVQVAHDVTELVVAKDLIYSIKDVL
jgi:hypothetical protein